MGRSDEAVVQLLYQRPVLAVAVAHHCVVLFWQLLRWQPGVVGGADLRQLDSLAAHYERLDGGIVNERVVIDERVGSRDCKACPWTWTCVRVRVNARVRVRVRM